MNTKVSARGLRRSEQMPLLNVPIYEDFFLVGEESTFRYYQRDDLPLNARRYLDRPSQVAGVPIAIVSTGPDRENTIPF